MRKYDRLLSERNSNWKYMKTHRTGKRKAHQLSECRTYAKEQWASEAVCWQAL